MSDTDLPGAPLIISRNAKTLRDIIKDEKNCLHWYGKWAVNRADQQAVASTYPAVALVAAKG